MTKSEMGKKRGRSAGKPDGRLKKKRTTKYKEQIWIRNERENRGCAYNSKN